MEPIPDTAQGTQNPRLDRPGTKGENQNYCFAEGTQTQWLTTSSKLIDQGLAQPSAEKLSSAADRTKLGNVQRDISEHLVLNGMSPSKPSPQGSGNSVEEEITLKSRSQDQQLMANTKQIQWYFWRLFLSHNILGIFLLLCPMSFFRYINILLHLLLLI